MTSIDQKNITNQGIEIVNRNEKRENQTRDVINICIILVVLVGFFFPFGINNIDHYRQNGWPFDEGEWDREKPAKEYEYQIFSHSIKEKSIERGRYGDVESIDR